MGNTSFEVFANKTVVGEIYQEVDGFYVFIFVGATQGYFPQEFFTFVSDELRTLNKAWEKDIEDFFRR